MFYVASCYNRRGSVLVVLWRFLFSSMLWFLFVCGLSMYRRFVCVVWSSNDLEYGCCFTVFEGV